LKSEGLYSACLQPNKNHHKEYSIIGIFVQVSSRPETEHGIK